MLADRIYSGKVNLWVASYLFQLPCWCRPPQELLNTHWVDLHALKNRSLRYQQNGRAGSSKLLSLYRNTEKKQKLAESTLSDIWKTVRGLQQPGECWIKNKQANKKQLSNDRKALWHFLLPLAPPPPQLAGVLEGGSPPTQCKTLTPSSIGSRADLIGKILCLSVLSSLGTAWDTYARSLVCLTWNSLRVEKWPALLRNIVRWGKTHSQLGLKITAETQQTAQRLGRKAGENCFEK